MRHKAKKHHIRKHKRRESLDSSEFEKGVKDESKDLESHHKRKGKGKIFIPRATLQSIPAER